jgi:alpha-L-fucosidase
MAGSPVSSRCDFRTAEYASYSRTAAHKWEATRGIGYSFGYNRREGPDNFISVEELIRSLVDIVSKNGNLLLNVGPRADGTIPQAQQERLLGLGQWLQVNGEAIFGTRPWRRAEGRTSAGTPLRFTQKGTTIYAILLERPAEPEIAIDLPGASAETSVCLLGQDTRLHWEQRGRRFTVVMPENLPDSPAYVMRLQQRME